MIFHKVNKVCKSLKMYYNLSKISSFLKSRYGYTTIFTVINFDKLKGKKMYIEVLIIVVINTVCHESCSVTVEMLLKHDSLVLSKGQFYKDLHIII